MTIEIRRSVVRWLHAKYLTGNMFYTLNNLSPDIDNVDQRIAQDAGQFSDTVGKLIASSSSICAQVLCVHVCGWVCRAGVVFGVRGYGVPCRCRVWRACVWCVVRGCVGVCACVLFGECVAVLESAETLPLHGK